ncbi:MAG: hypothetical protein J7M14_03350, partial [Planctomycetes bacterium]|nr:hypothetical protein [Planctomycetota bacterium]
MKIPQVPSGHPRVYVRPDDLPAIRAKLTQPKFAKAWSRVRKAAASKRVSRGSAFCSAFIYLVSGDKAHGRRAVESALRALKGSKDPRQAARTFRRPMHWASCVYDWCYDLITDEEKAAFVREFERIAALHEPGYPAALNEFVVVGHSCEGWLLTGQLPAGVAIYDENKKMYDTAAKAFFVGYVPVRNFHYPAHWHHQGDSYGTRLIYDLGATWLFRRMGAGDVLSREQQFVPYHWIYNLRPDSQQIRRGDSFRTGRSGRKRGNMIMAGSYYDDPHLLWLADSGIIDNMLGYYNDVFELLLRPSDVERRDFTDLPLTKYFPEPAGEMVARTGWSMGINSRDAIVYMRLGGTFFGNHQKLDMGTFQIYYRGALAIASGTYADSYGTPHWKNYYHKTVSSNGLLVFNPEEAISGGTANDGGQYVANGGRDHPRDLEALLTKGYKQGKVLGHAIGPDAMTPEYSYIAGDITGAYTKKVSSATRSMVTLNLSNEKYPCMLVVFDRL